MTLFGLLLVALPLQHDPGAIGAPHGWRYVVPERGDPFEHPPWRAVGLSATRPADLVEKVVYRAHPRYAHLRSGEGAVLDAMESGFT